MNINSGKDNIMSVKEQIAEILTQREVWSKDVKNSLGHWLSIKERIEKLEKVINELEKICKKTNVEDENLSELKKYLTELREQTAVNKLMSGVRDGIKQLNILEERFDRKTLNIVVAGVGRCGKSTSLKSILGFDQDDNTVIPSGKGTAVTATKSTVTHVEKKEDEKSQIVFLTETAFLERLNKYFKSCGLDEIHDLEDFENLDFEEISKTFNEVLDSAEKKVEELECEAEAQGISKDDYAPYCKAKGFYDKLSETDEGVFKKKIGPMHKHFMGYKHLLNADPISIPLNETYRYAKYPTDGSCPLCFAVEECRIFCQFPEDLTGLQVVDLPGWGTADPCEEDVFKKGFGYFVDLVLMVRRPDGTQQNADTKLDKQVVGILKSKLQRDLFSDRVLLFQNDAGIEETMTSEEWKTILDSLAEWSQGLKIECIRGDGYDKDFMQKDFLSQVLQFMLEKLPSVDEKLKASNYDTLGSIEQEIELTLTDIENHLQQLRNGFPRSGGAVGVGNLVNEILLKISEKLEIMRENWLSNTTLNDEMLEALSSVNKDLENDFITRYNENDERILEHLKSILRAMHFPGEYLTEQYHSIRINTCKAYGQLEGWYNKEVLQMQRQIAQIMQEVIPNKFFTQHTTLDDVITFFEKEQPSPEIARGFKELRGAKILFRNVSSSLLRQVFKDALTSFFNDIPINGDIDSRAKLILQKLLSFALRSNDRTFTFLRNQNHVLDHLYTESVFFEDILVRSDIARIEWINFVEAHWGQIHGEQNFYRDEIRSAIDKLCAKTEN